ncbi:MAG: TIGR04372 family glycosyltransferase [Proteobacteria bacterium]|nr:TIGR04372 family glycosyltransferase [Pseudomonadota bacterium]
MTADGRGTAVRKVDTISTVSPDRRGCETSLAPGANHGTHRTGGGGEIMLGRYLSRALAATRVSDWRLILHRHLMNVVVKAIHLFDWRLIEVSNPHRIGHLCVEVDCYLKDMILRGTLPGKIFMVRTDLGFANDTVATYLSTYVRIFRGRFLQDCFKLAGLYVSATVRTHPYAVAMYKTAACYDVYSRWGQRAPLFRLSRRDMRFGEAQLHRLGVPKDAWFVCVHAREPGYSPTDEAWHSYRNMDVEDYDLAIKEITARGGWCIRMGDATMKPIRPRANVVDYARSEMKSARMDVFLGARCRFFLGCASGPIAIATMFGRPAAVVNMAPLAAAYAFSVNDVAIPQRVRFADGRLPAFEEIMAHGTANFRLTEEFERRGITLVKASPEEIRDLVVEMIERVEARAEYTPEDEDRQQRFRALFREGHYAYKAGSRIGRDFLRKYMTD